MIEHVVRLHYLWKFPVAFLYLFSVIYSFLLLGCISNTILIEKNNIIRFETNEIYENEHDYIEMSGLIGSSSYNYKNIDVIIENENMKILLYGELSPINKNGSGSFNIYIPIEKYIDKIFFGKEKEIIWERKSIETLEKREEILYIKKHTQYNEIIDEFGEADAIIGSGFLIIQYTLNNNRKAILNFGGHDKLLQLIEKTNNEEKIIFDF